MYTHPQEKANGILTKLNRQLSFLATELPIDCQCEDHIGPHQVHLSRTILLSNFKVLFDHLQHGQINEFTAQVINAVLDVLDSESQRQVDLMSELPLLASRYWKAKVK